MKTVSIKKTEIGLGLPKITVPVMGRDMQEMLLSARAAAKDADILEIRLDSFERVLERPALRDLLKALREYTPLPLLVTFRTAAEGGARALSEQEYQDLLLYIMKECRPDLLDVEFRRTAAAGLLANAERLGIPTVASFHDFSATPDEDSIKNLLGQMAYAGASVAKAAFMPNGREDVETVLSAGLSLKGKLPVPMVLISMGELGRITRYGAEQLGSALTFASAGGVLSAPGQMDAQRLREILQERHEGASRKGHIFLVGFMGTGKTTVGRELGSRTGLPVLEMDSVIEQMDGRKIPDIFAESGEAYFRDLESKALEGLFSRGRTIVSCGGGMVLRASNVLQMRAIGHIVRLVASPKSVYRRVRWSFGSRPLLKGRMSPEGIGELMAVREPFYVRAADISVETDGRKVRDIAFEILTRTGCTDDRRDRR